MRKLILLFLFPLIFFSCGNNIKSPNEKEQTVSDNPKEEKEKSFKSSHILEIGDNLKIAGFDIKIESANIATELPAIFDDKIYADGYFLVMSFIVKNESSRYRAVSNVIGMHVVNSDGLVQKYLDSFSAKMKDEYEHFELLVVPEGFSKRAYAIFEIPDKSEYYLSFIGDGGRSMASLENIIK
ncbi:MULTISPECIES: hypothetical protein [unclassified Dysgonomonas]|jgi:hypothetical protein|uniref:hypothetical protein n=1 Tax=unclassified Dysgonomonas TaxID=2630389 RepID=UPI0025BE8641|nr:MULTISPECIES: hypothetical protein [unclassified Dysgonomonas]MDR2003965.1 hypothetical protein [Prevotella sp.]HMM03995.1 hypothetical protein [Dysgonomonas sp.]